MTAAGAAGCRSESVREYQATYEMSLLDQDLPQSQIQNGPCQGSCAIQDVRQKLTANPNFAMYDLVITYIPFIQSFWIFAESTAVEQLKRILWTKEVSRDLILRWVSDRYAILHSTLVHFKESCIWVHIECLGSRFPTRPGHVCNSYQNFLS